MLQAIHKRFFLLSSCRQIFSRSYFYGYGRLLGVNANWACCKTCILQQAHIRTVEKIIKSFLQWIYKKLNNMMKLVRSNVIVHGCITVVFFYDSFNTLESHTMNVLVFLTCTKASVAIWCGFCITRINNCNDYSSPCSIPSDRKFNLFFYRLNCRFKGIGQQTVQEFVNFSKGRPFLFANP